MATLKCTAAGDAMVFRRFPGEYAGFPELRDFIMRGDFRFFNLETTVHDFETPGAALSGGSWFCAEPEVLHDMHRFGFNVLGTANNHSLDYGPDGLKKTLEYVKKEGFAAAGTGLTMAQATAPCYLDTVEGRYAMIACTTSFTNDCIAGEQTRLAPGRPGVNAIRNQAIYQVSPSDIETIRNIAKKTAINGAADISRSEGYRPAIPEGKAELGGLLFEASDTPGTVTTVNKKDLERMKNAIRDAKFFSDYVVISVHSHQIRGFSKEDPAQFCEELCRACIDAGADAVIGTGPHLLRPIEIYKGKPIFYSLGDFILENETMKAVPAGMFEKQGMTGNETMAEMYESRSHGGQRGLYYTKVMFEAVVPYWEVTDGKLTKIELMPVELGYGTHRSTGGLPRPCYDKGILERLQKMSKAYGTEIEIGENGIGTVKL